MAQFGIKEVMDFTITDYNPVAYKREPLFSVDYAQVTDIENSAERIDISGGRGNSRLLSFDHSKTSMINVTLPLVDMKMLAAISGDNLEDKIKEVFKREVLIVKGDTDNEHIELKHEPIGESLYVYTLEGYRDLGTKLTKVTGDAPVTIGENEYDVDDVNAKMVKVNGTSHPVGTEIVVYYHTKTSKATQTLQINPKKFTQAISFYGDTLFRNQFTEIDEVYNVVGHKGRIRPNYTLSMNATDVTVLELTIDLYAVKDQETGEELYVEYIKDEVEETIE